MNWQIPKVIIANIKLATACLQIPLTAQYNGPKRNTHNQLNGDDAVSTKLFFEFLNFIKKLYHCRYIAVKLNENSFKR